MMMQPAAAQGPKRKRATRASKAVVLAEPSAPQGLPALFERAAAASNFDVDALAKLMAIKREIEADAERRAFDQDFAALQAEIVRVEANAYDPQKRRSYADLNALTDAVGPLIAAKSFAITFDTEPSTVSGSVKITAKLTRNGVERAASVDMPMDGAGMRGNANMSAPQAYVSTTTHGRKLAVTLLFNLTVSAPQKAAEPERQLDDAPPWDAPPRSAASDSPLAVLKQAAQRSSNPASDKQIEFLADLMRQRGERPEAVLDDQGRLSNLDAWQAIDARKGVRP